MNLIAVVANVANVFAVVANVANVFAVVAFVVAVVVLLLKLLDVDNVFILLKIL
jgi:hypothetical protein